MNSMLDRLSRREGAKLTMTCCPNTYAHANTMTCKGKTGVLTCLILNPGPP